MKYFVVAGEASGDMHAARLVEELQLLDKQAMCIGWGGDQMKASGVTILKHVSDLAFMGFSQVIMNIRTILGNFKVIKDQIKKAHPDVLILVDYPGFNLRLAKWAKQEGYKVVYYIAPQAWAWKENRVEKLKAYTDQLICILPFEKKFFEDRDLQVKYVGHPLLEQIKVTTADPQNIIAVLPGSRAQEVKSMLPSMLSVLDSFPDYTFKIAQSPNLLASVYDEFVKHNRVELHTSGMASLLSQSKAAMVTSGTATLETALYNIPQVVCYKSGPVSYQIAKRIIKVPYISLVNLIAGEEIVKELIQSGLTRSNLTEELNLLLDDKGAKMKNDYRQLQDVLGNGDASAKAAKIIEELLTIAADNN